MAILTLLMFLLLGASYFTKRERTAKCQEMKEWEKLHREKKEDQRAKEEALNAIGKAGQWPRPECGSWCRGKVDRGPLPWSKWWRKSREDMELWRLNGSGAIMSRILSCAFVGLSSAIFAVLRDGSSCLFLIIFQMNSKQTSVSSAFSLELFVSSLKEIFWSLAHLFPVLPFRLEEICLPGW